MTWDPDNPLDPASFRHASQPGDFELESLQLEDVLVTVYQPGNFRPYTASIFRADMRTFRKQWLFYDFLSAENVVGQFDNCLFSLHRPQSIGRTTDQDLKDGKWVRMVFHSRTSIYSRISESDVVFTVVSIPDGWSERGSPTEHDDRRRSPLLDHIR